MQRLQRLFGSKTVAEMGRSAATAPQQHRELLHALEMRGLPRSAWLGEQWELKQELEKIAERGQK